MTTAPTVSPEAFLADPAHAVGEEPASVEHRLADLEARVWALESGTYPEELPSRDELLVREDEHAAELIDTSHELADLEAKHDVVLQLVERIAGIVKKSTSKVSLEVKAAIDEWANPSVPLDDEDQEPGPAVPQPSIVVGPAHDAPVEEWRAYARAIHAVSEGTLLDQMNRSQIRTMLGIEQPVGA